MRLSRWLLLAILVAAVHGSSPGSKLAHRHPPSAPPASRPAPSGDIYVHDSSGVVYDNSSRSYFTFASGMGADELIAVRQSVDGYNWTRVRSFWTDMPEWVRLKVPNTERGWWAPDATYLNGWWHLYYAVSSGGSQHSCIGLAVNRRLDASDPLFEWHDAGAVLCSTEAQPWNCIDVHVFVDPNTQAVWMNWGSYWNGLFVQQLQGYPIVSIPVGAATNIARHDVEIHPIEAAWVQPWPSAINPGAWDFWYFVDWEYCCRGVNSTYDIRVGRSTTRPAGPYLDRAGVDMARGGGTEFLGTQVQGEGRQIGPGQIGFPWGGPQGTGGPQHNASTPVVSYFYYDRANEGQFTLGQAKVTWEGEGWNAWPVASERL